LIEAALKGVPSVHSSLVRNASNHRTSTPGFAIQPVGRTRGVWLAGVSCQAAWFDTRPPFPLTKPQIELPLFVLFAAAHNQQIVALGQSSHQWCEFWQGVIHSVELPHSTKICGGIASHAWVAALNSLGKRFHRPLSPIVAQTPP
jgi:hypothetical protein